jgi:hypothetical protein
MPAGTPEPGGNWTGRETSLIGGVWEQQLVSWSYSKVTEYRIGACSYPAIWIHETRTPSDTSTSSAPWINQYVHLIDLGLSVYLGGEEVGDRARFLKPRSVFRQSRPEMGRLCCDAASVARFSRVRESTVHQAMLVSLQGRSPRRPRAGIEQACGHP